jgi:predicted nucleic acid-binding protein
MLKIYLDNCCYNRPFDNQKDAAIAREAQAKLFIQSLVRYHAVELAYSLISLQEIADSPFEENSRAIADFIEAHALHYVGGDSARAAIPLTREIMLTGIKLKDAAHVACAIVAQCDYFLTTDKRLLKYADKRIKLANPVEFVRIWETQS